MTAILSSWQCDKVCSCVPALPNLLETQRATLRTCRGVREGLGSQAPWGYPQAEGYSKPSYGGNEHVLMQEHKAPRPTACPEREGGSHGSTLWTSQKGWDLGCLQHSLPMLYHLTCKVSFKCPLFACQCLFIYLCNHPSIQSFIFYPAAVHLPTHSSIHWPFIHHL